MHVNKTNLLIHLFVYSFQFSYKFSVYYLIPFYVDVKSMVSVGLTTLASCNYDLMDAVRGKKTMRILCIGHGGGSLPLFLASKIQGGYYHFH